MLSGADPPVEEVQMDNEIALELRERLEAIAAMGPVESLRTGPTGVGFTLGTLLGIKANSSGALDYKGIQITSGRWRLGDRSRNRSTLFSKTPDWSTSTLRSGSEVLDTYGYVGSETGRQQLYCTVSNIPNAQSLYFELPEGSAYLVNASQHLDGDRGSVVHWPWIALESALEQKHRETFWVGAETSVAGGASESFHYNAVRHTRSPIVANFRMLVGAGKITMDYTLSRLASGRIRDHGYLFKIHVDDLGLLFPASETFSLLERPGMGVGSVTGGGIAVTREQGDSVRGTEGEDRSPVSDPETNGVQPGRQSAQAETPTWISYLPERAFGGGQVAAIPGIEPDDFWPEAPSAAGADEAIESFRNAIDEGGAPTLLFLVGGPGNGKSLLSSRAIEGLARTGMSSHMPASRSYEFEHENGARVLLVNDATIRYSPQQRHGLVEEVQQALDEDLFLLVNANRGVLAESLAAATGNDSDGVAVLRWVEGHEDGDSRDSFFRSMNLPGTNSASVVYLDACSLLEVRPTTTDVGKPERYKVHRFRKREQMGETPALVLLSGLIDECSQRPDGFEGVPNEWNPVAANLASLQSGKVRIGVTSLLRAAEIATGSRLTYRELWGAFARALMGGYDRGHRAVGPDLFERRAILEGEQAELGCLLELSANRLHQSLFAAGHVTTTGEARQDSSESPIARLLAPVDPVRDAIPGDIDEWGRGWSTPVNEALELRISADQPPLANLAAGDTDVAAYVQPFDFNLEAKVLAALGSKGDAATQRLQSWYGQYLARLYAVAKGIPGFAQEIDIWTECWQQARGGQLPQSVYPALKALLLPSFADTPNLVLPALESRTLPLRDHQEQPIIVAKLAPDTILLSPSVDGDEVLLRLANTRDHDTLAELPLDFHLIRELRAVGAGVAGITDAGYSASPRLERARSSLLLAANDPTWAVAAGRDLIDLEGVNE